MTSPVPPEVSSKIANWRLKAADNTLTLDEMKEGIKLIRAGRMSAASSAAAGRKKKPVDVPKADDMLGELEGM